MEILKNGAVAALAPGSRLGIIGAGSMGGALLRGVLGSGVPLDAVWAATKSATSAHIVASEFGIAAHTSYAELTAAATCCCWRKAGSTRGRVARTRRGRLRPDTLVISVAAGVSIARIEAALGTANPVVRAMPNTPSFVGRGMTAISSGSHASAAHLAIAERLFSAVGLCITIEERLLNAVTAISGSGPAYVYLIIEALADAGVRVGLPRDVAMTLVTQTVLGAAVMVQENDRHPAALRDDVTTARRLHDRGAARDGRRQAALGAGACG